MAMDASLQRALMIGGASATATFLGTSAFSYLLNHYRQDHGLDPFPPDTKLDGVKAGAGLGVTALLAPPEHAPLVVGLGVGVAARSLASLVQLEQPAQAQVIQGIGETDQAEEGADEPGEPTVDIVDVPDYPWNRKYQAISRIFVHMMNKNRRTSLGTTIPAERWHPDVVQYARGILAEQGVDGKDFMKIVAAVWQHFKGAYTYSYDPRRENTDFFVAPHIFLRPTELGGFGVTGDCDDVSMAVSAVLLGLGVPSAMVMIKQRPEYPYFNHIFPAALLPEKDFGHMVPKDPRYRVRLPSGERGVLIPMEFTRDRDFGYMPQFVKRQVIFFDRRF